MFSLNRHCCRGFTNGPDDIPLAGVDLEIADSEAVEQVCVDLISGHVGRLLSGELLIDPVYSENVFIMIENSRGENR